MTSKLLDEPTIMRQNYLMPSKNKGFALVPLIVLVGVLAIALFIYKNPQFLSTIGWKTYKNEKYGFSFKYPSDWIEDEKNGVIASKIIKPFYQEGISFEVYEDSDDFLEYLDKVFYKDEDYADEGSQYLKKLYMEDYRDGKGLTSITLGGKPAILIDELIIPAGSTGNGVWVKFDGKGLLLRLHSTADMVKGMKVFDTIVDTLKFTDFATKSGSDMPELPNSVVWSEVSENEQQLNYPGLWGSTGSLPNDTYNIKLTGKEWVATKEIKSLEEDEKEDSSGVIRQYAKELVKRGWDNSGSFTLGDQEFDIVWADGFGFGKGGVFKIGGSDVRIVNTFMKIVGSWEIKEGPGAGYPEFNYPHTEEYRIFISDPVSKEYLLSTTQTNEK